MGTYALEFSRSTGKILIYLINMPLAPNSKSR